MRPGVVGGAVVSSGFVIASLVMRSRAKAACADAVVCHTEGADFVLGLGVVGLIVTAIASATEGDFETALVRPR
jgi:hypothetical protein